MLEERAQVGRERLEVYEDRHCGRAVPGVANDAGVLQGVVPTLPTLPGLPVPVPTPTLPTTDQLQALVPNELLDRINKYAYANAPAGSVPAPACKKQAPYTYGGETTQYPHVKAGTGR